MFRVTGERNRANLAYDESIRAIIARATKRKAETVKLYKANIVLRLGWLNASPGELYRLTDEQAGRIREMQKADEEKKKDMPGWKPVKGGWITAVKDDKGKKAKTLSPHAGKEGGTTKPETESVERTPKSGKDK